MEYYPLQQPEDISEREKEDAMGSYLMMFAAVAIGLPLPIINIGSCFCAAQRTASSTSCLLVTVARNAALPPSRIVECSDKGTFCCICMIFIIAH